MDIFTIMTLAAAVPQTGDRFPVVPLIIGGIAATGIAIFSTFLALKTDKDDEDEDDKK